MAIPKNAVNFRTEAQALAQALDRYEEFASWMLSRNTIPALISGQVKLKSAQSNINAIMNGRAIDDFATALQDIFQLDVAAWNAFKASAASVHGTLVPAVFTEVQNNEATLLAQSFGADGVPVASGTLPAGSVTAIRAALQAVVDEYA